MSNWFKKWLKMVAVLYGVFLIGAVVLNKLGLVVYMLLFGAGLVVFVAWQVIKVVALILRRIVVTIDDLLRTRYVVVFKF